MLSPLENPSVDFLTMERAVMCRFIESKSPMSEVIARQYAEARTVRRELSGTGFFSHFAIPNSAARITPSSFEISEVATLSDGLGVGFTLFVRDGQIGWLEGYTYGDTAWPEHPVIREWELFTENGPR